MIVQHEKFCRDVLHNKYLNIETECVPLQVLETTLSDEVNEDFFSDEILSTSPTLAKLGIEFKKRDSNVDLEEKKEFVKNAVDYIVNMKKSHR